MKCEYCLKEHDGSYGSGRFCCQTCARGFSSKDKREQINRAVSNKLKGRKNPHAKGFVNDEQKELAINAWLKKSAEIRNWKLLNIPFENLNKPCKKLKLLIEQQNKCAICNIDNTWNNMPLKLQFDHINGDHADSSKSNLRMICPNCHSQTNTYAGKNISVEGLRRIKKVAKKTHIKHGKKACQAASKIFSLYNANVAEK